MSTASRISSVNIPVAKPFFGEAEESAVLEALRSGWVSQGPKVAEFERQFAQYVGAKEAIAVSSCTTALHLAMLALDVRPGDEVICPSLSFIATANSIAYAGAFPVFVDIEPRYFNLDPARIEGAITTRTKGILVVHQIGHPAEMERINEIARKYGLWVMEDAACAVGAEYKGQRIGAPHSRLACFSFHPRKVLTTGEGGMITTNDSECAARLRRLRQHAMSVSDVARHSAKTAIIETYDEVGYNYRMTDLQAALGIVQLDRLPGFLERRRSRAQRYTEALSEVNCLVPPAQAEGSLHTYQSYMVRVLPHSLVTRDQLMQKLLDRGISTRRGIMAIHREKPYAGNWSLAETDRVTDECIILPLYHQMTDIEQEYVIHAVLESIAA